jgi:hypothetical protein
MDHEAEDARLAHLIHRVVRRLRWCRSWTPHRADRRVVPQVTAAGAAVPIHPMIRSPTFSPAARTKTRPSNLVATAIKHSPSGMRSPAWPWPRDHARRPSSLNSSPCRYCIDEKLTVPLRCRCAEDVAPELDPRAEVSRPWLDHAPGNRPGSSASSLGSSPEAAFPTAIRGVGYGGHPPVRPRASADPALILMRSILRGNDTLHFLAAFE